MKKIFTTISILVFISTSLFSQAIPELLYYRFNGVGTSVPNLASAPPVGTTTATIMGGQTQGSTGQCSGALVGSGVTSTTDYVNTGWAPNLGNSSWTISFWSGNITPSATLFYILGDVNTSSLRCFTNGVAGANNWILRGGGLTDVLIAGGATVAPHINTFVYDNVANNVKAYLDGVLVNTVAQVAPNLTGTGPFKVGGYSANTGLNLAGNLDEFRVYNRAISPAEVLQLVNLNPTVSLGPDFTQCGSAILDAQNAGSTYLWSDATTLQTLSVSTTGTYSVTVTNASGCSASSSVNATINPLPTVALGADITQCGGTVVLDAQNAGSTYLWSDGSTAQTLSVSSSGTYSVAVTGSNGCTNSDTVMATINPLPVVALGSDFSQCGSATLDAQNVGATYLWSDASTTQTISVNATGTYSVLVTDLNGCSNSDTVMVTINAIPTVALGADVTQCGGTVSFDAQNAGSSYLWSDGSTAQTFTTSTSGTFSVTVTDANGCSNSDNVMATINALPTVALGPDDIQCGGVYTLNAGNVGSTYLWSNASTNQFLVVSSTGTYSVLVTDANGCINSDTVMVTINSAPSVTGSATSTSVCLSDANVTLTGTPIGGTWSGPGVVGSSFTPSTAGVGAQTTTYNFTDVNGCTGSATVIINVNACVGVNESSLISAVNIFPNPNSGSFTFQLGADVQDLKITITDLQGRVVFVTTEKFAANGFSKQINLQNEESGIYLMQVAGNGLNAVEKIAVQR